MAQMTQKKKQSVYDMTVCALMAAVMCVLGPLSIPIGPVPISLTNFVVCLAVLLLGTRGGTVSVLVYLLIGLVGMPVFSGYSGGLGKLAGPTGGYLIGFVLQALIAGIILKKGQGKLPAAILGMVLGVLADYALGTVWFVVQAQCSVGYALTVCVLPFLVGDLAKIALANLVGIPIRSRLQQAGLLR
ncbi:MAG: biotin transporter BioY [Oscillospiraceae bacterium]|nr:biotin transporter BioY [Oscillospiraceae bacterium]